LFFPESSSVELFPKISSVMTWEATASIVYMTQPTHQSHMTEKT